MIQSLYVPRAKPADERAGRQVDFRRALCALTGYIETSYGPETGFANPKAIEVGGPTRSQRGEDPRPGYHNPPRTSL
jgi:hypothetical protein